MRLFRMIFISLLMGATTLSCVSQAGSSQSPDDSLTPEQKLDQACRLDYHVCQVDFARGAKGKPETMLAGIDVRLGHIQQIARS